MIEKIQSNKELIKYLLEKYPACRNSDSTLLRGVWYHQVPNFRQLSAVDLMQLLSDNKIANPETIRRCRQKLQEDYPELRGDNYVVRHQMAKDVRKNIKDI